MKPIAAQFGLAVGTARAGGFIRPSISFAMLMACKTDLSVINAGGYRFSDFMRIGVPLTLGTWPILSWLLPITYEL